MIQEKGLIYRRVLQFGPLLSRNIRKHLKSTNDSWRMDKTYLKIRGKDMCLYRAVDSSGHTIEFWLSGERDKKLPKSSLRRLFPLRIIQAQRLLQQTNMQRLRLQF